MPRLKLSLDETDYRHLYMLEQSQMLTQEKKFQFCRDSNIEYERLFLTEYPEWRRRNEHPE